MLVGDRAVAFAMSGSALSSADDNPSPIDHSS